MSDKDKIELTSDQQEMLMREALAEGGAGHGGRGDRHQVHPGTE